jgi:thioesterase domain-containing protein
MTLYDITGEYLRLYDLMTDDETNNEAAIMTAFEELHYDLSQKSAGYVAIIKQLEMESDECDKQIEYFSQKKKQRQNSVKRLKEALLNAMDIANLNEIKAGSWTIKVAKNGGKTPVEIPDESKVPENFMRIKYEVDKDLIRQSLEEGKELSFAKLGERGRHLNIK